jgi:hypothetical protein
MRTGLSLLAAGLLALALPHAAGADTKKAIWGPVRMPDGSSAFPVYRDLGVDILQITLKWSAVAPTRPADPVNPDDPAYSWPAEIDYAIRHGRRRGISVALLVRDSPPWANGGRSPEWAPKQRAYASFLIAASRRYPSVRRWMIWGEPNRAGSFQPLPPRSPVGPRAYARLLDAAYGALKRRRRTNVVVGGMTFSFGEVLPRPWLRWMRLPGGRRPRLDEYGHNPFTRRAPNIRLSGYGGFPGARDISDVDTFAKEVRSAYRRTGRRPRLWLSEFTVSSDRPNRAFSFAVSRRKQARWLKGAFRIAARVRASGIGWFNLHDEPASDPFGLTTGLMTYEGAKKPAYRAYKRLR